jgi:hypothetical protein
MLHGRRHSSPVSFFHWSLVVVVVLYGTCLRGCRLGEAPLWTDEAETAVNALTILADGVPSSHYLGQPIFENTLVEAWPDHPEYEFRDSSYSRRGVAIYHGWLPLYATALSFWLSGVAPDAPPPASPPHRTAADQQRRSVAARVPAVVFAVVFLIAIFMTAYEAYGTDAAWAALCAAAVSTSAIIFARQARYYSPTLALSALCALCLVRIVERGRRRDFAYGGALLALLFHTNALALSGMVAAFASCTVLLLRQPRLLAKLALLGGVFALGVGPWIVATGVLDSAIRLPPARTLLGLDAVIDYLWRRLPFVAVAVATVTWLVSIRVFRGRLPERLRRPFVHSQPIFIALAAWTTGAFLAFNLLVPAASYFQSRLSLILLVPALLFGATLFAAIARALTRHHSPLLASTLFLLVLVPAGKVTAWWPPSEQGVQPLFEVIDHLRNLPLGPDVRLYSDTGTALPLMFYSGLPVQNVMPVRRGYLEDYPGELIVVEGPSTAVLSPAEVQHSLAGRGKDIDERQAHRLSLLVRDHALRDALTRRGAVVCSVLPAPPVDLAELQQLQSAKTSRLVAEDIDEHHNPMFDGFRIDTFTEMWQVFFYRFVDPESRMGARLNYAARVPGASAKIQSGGWVVLRSPARRPGPLC